MKLFACVPDQLCQSGLDVHVNIFSVDSPFEFTALDLTEHIGEPLLNQVVLLFCQDAGFGKHIGVSTRAGNVITSQLTIEPLGGSESLHKGICRFGKSTTPQVLTAFHVAITHNRLFLVHGTFLKSTVSAR